MFLRLHRWVSILFSIPLMVIIFTGLIISYEPIINDKTTRYASLSASSVVETLAAHDPDGKAKRLTIRAFENRMVIQGAGKNGSLTLDLATRKVVDDSERTMLSDVFSKARGLHAHFLNDLRWAVIASTIALIVMMILGVLIRWPRIRHTLTGWHQGVAWIGLPLLALSPVTGLMVAFGISFPGVLQQDRAAPSPPPPIRQAVLKLGDHMQKQGRDLGGLIWLRTRDGRMLARVNVGGDFHTYMITRDEVVLTQKSWERALHEGNAYGRTTGTMTAVTSLGFLFLMGSGLFMWLRRTVRRSVAPQSRVAPAE